MGASLVYLEKPNKDIEFDVGENSHFKFVAGGMQGWRINMVSILKPYQYSLWLEITLLWLLDCFAIGSQRIGVVLEALYTMFFILKDDC